MFTLLQHESNKPMTTTAERMKLAAKGTVIEVNLGNTQASLEKGIRRIGTALRSQANALDMTYADISAKSGCCYGTIHKLLNHEVKSPHFRTTIRIARALGFKCSFHQ